MKKRFVHLLLLMSFTFCQAKDHPTLLPQPQEIRYGQSQVRISDLSIYLPFGSSPEDQFNANELAYFLKSRTGISIPLIPLKKGRQIIINHGNLPALPGLNETTGPNCREAHIIKITSEGIIVNGNSSAAAYYAVQTLRQLPEGTGDEAFFPEAEISDYPAGSTSSSPIRRCSCSTLAAAPST